MRGAGEDSLEVGEEKTQALTNGGRETGPKQSWGV